MAARKALAARRKALGLTQEDLAEAMRVERSTVARWEQGISDPRPWHQRRLSQALDLTPAELAPLLEPQPVAVTDAGLETWESRWAVPVSDDRREPVGEAYVESLRGTARQLIDLDTHYGGDDLVRLAVRSFRSAYQRLASGLYIRDIEHDLQAAIGELGQVAAWIAYDADQQALSRQLNNEALLHSRLAGDRSMELFELGQVAMQAVHLQRPAEALRISDAVIAAEPSSPRTAAVFRIRRARALGQADDAQRALKEHDRAGAVLNNDAASSDPEWTWWVDSAELAWHQAMTLAALGRWSTAVDLFQAAYEMRPRTAERARYNDLTHLLEAQATLRTWHDADDTLTAIHAHGSDIRSGRTTALLRRVLRPIERSADAPSSLTDAAHELSGLLGTPS